MANTVKNIFFWPSGCTLRRPWDIQRSGNFSFIKWVKEKYYRLKKDDEIPQSRQLAPTIVEIKEAVSRKYEVTASSLEEGKRGQVNEPRNVAIYLARKHSGLPLKKIGKEFGLEKYSSVSSIVSRTTTHLAQSKQMRRQIEEIMQQLEKGQADTAVFRSSVLLPTPQIIQSLVLQIPLAPELERSV